MTARRYAKELLRGLGCESLLQPGRTASESSARRWAESGLLALTGFSDRAPVLPTVALPSAADGALAALGALAPEGAFGALLGGAELLAERAALAGLGRRGRISAGGACRLLQTADGWLAVNLPREEDARSLSAWLEDDSLEGVDSLDAGVWECVALRLRARSAAELEMRSGWLGLAVARALPPASAPPSWLRVEAGGGQARVDRPAAPLVLDLSSLWAGPLAGRLLRLAGARVIKVESVRRPDGARYGPQSFFDLLNAGKESVALDLSESEGRGALARLLERADLVIESARPRGLAQLGFDASAWAAERAGRIWLSITGYGRTVGERIGFGDDAAAAAGLCWCVPTDAPLFVGDAIADPLAGVHAALAAQAYWRRGEGALLDVSLSGVVAHAIAATDPVDERGAGSLSACAAPRAPEIAARARSLGADTARVLAE
jgi:hypothetical protein